MNRKYRKTIIAGNWKMNMTVSAAKPFIDELRAVMPKTRGCDTVLCVPFPLIPAVQRTARDARIAVGAQNVCEFEGGAFTGEVSAAMLRDLEVKYCIIGHNERRGYFGEIDRSINVKAKVLLAAGISPIICVGEDLEQRERDITLELISIQVKSALYGVDPDQLRRCVIAYEPIWAIGTGNTATAQQAQEVCAHIRSVLRGLYGARLARGVTILYGGSMNGDNAAQLLAMPDIDGGLIGGASLRPGDFARIIAATVQEET